MAIAVRRIASKTALAALTKYAADDVVFVVASNDIYKFDATSSAVHDGTDVIKPDDRLARKPGRWLRAKFKAEDVDFSEAMPAHAAAHENGGDDEISVDGLAGVLADPQKADTLVETGGPTDLAMGAVQDGHLLQRVGAGIAGKDPAEIVPTVSPGEVLGLPADAGGDGPAEALTSEELKTIVGVPPAEPATAPTTYPDPSAVAIGVLATSVLGMRFMPDPADKSQIASYGAGSITLARGGNNYTDGTDASGSYCRGKNTVGALVDFNTGGAGYFKGSHLKLLTMIVKTETVIPAAAGEFWFCGLTSVNDPESFPTPKVAEYAGFLFDYDDAGANIVAFTSDGVDDTSDHRTKVDTGVAMAANTRYVLGVARTTTGWAFYINGTRVAHILSASGHVPSDSTALKLHLVQLADDGGAHNGSILFGGTSISQI